MFSSNNSVAVPSIIPNISPLPSRTTSRIVNAIIYNYGIALISSLILTTLAFIAAAITGGLLDLTSTKILPLLELFYAYLLGAGVYNFITATIGLILDIYRNVDNIRCILSFRENERQKRIDIRFSRRQEAGIRAILDIIGYQPFVWAAGAVLQLSGEQMSQLLTISAVAMSGILPATIVTLIVSFIHNIKHPATPENPTGRHIEPSPYATTSNQTLQQHLHNHNCVVHIHNPPNLQLSQPQLQLLPTTSTTIFPVTRARTTMRNMGHPEDPYLSHPPYSDYAPRGLFASSAPVPI